MNTLQAIILGIVEGITEFLPISSTAHLEFTAQLLHVPETDFLKSFTIIIQLGAILPVLWLYLKKYAFNWAVHTRVLIAFLPTGVIGFLLYKIVKQYFLGNTLIPIIALSLGGLVLIIFEKTHRDDKSTIQDITALSLRTAFIIGCIQALAVIPGVSRSAATIIGGMWLGMKRTAVVEFSFLLAVPTMIAATSYDLLKSANTFTTDQFWVLAVGFIVALIFAYISIRWLLEYVRKHTFTSFGVYRIAIAAVFLGIFLYFG